MTDVEQMIVVGLILMIVVGILLLFVYSNLRSRILSMEKSSKDDIESLRNYVRGETQHLSVQQAEFTRQMIEANRRND